jgi:hypothetical protein
MPAKADCDDAVQVCLGDIFEAGVSLLQDSHYTDQVCAADLAVGTVDEILASVHHLLRYFDDLIELSLLHNALNLGDEECQLFLTPTFERREELVCFEHIQGGILMSLKIKNLDAEVSFVHSIQQAI